MASFWRVMANQGTIAWPHTKRYLRWLDFPSFNSPESSSKGLPTWLMPTFIFQTWQLWNILNSTHWNPHILRMASLKSTDPYYFSFLPDLFDQYDPRYRHTYMTMNRKFIRHHHLIGTCSISQWTVPHLLRLAIVTNLHSLSYSSASQCCIWVLY